MPDDSNPFLNLGNRQSYGGEYNETEYQRQLRERGVANPPTRQQDIARLLTQPSPSHLRDYVRANIREVSPAEWEARVDPPRWRTIEEFRGEHLQVPIETPAEERRRRRGPYVTTVNYGNNGRRPQPSPAPIYTQELTVDQLFDLDLPDDSVEAPPNDRKPPDPRLAVIKMGPQRRGFHCPYCYNKFSPQIAHPRQRTRDHVWPSSRYPRIADRLLVYACRQCNGDKANHTVYEWLEMLRQVNDPRVKIVVRFINLLAPWLRSSQQ